MKNKFFLFVLLTVLLSGCSMIEHFIIVNESASDITIEYELYDPGNRFPLFHDSPTAYKISKSGSVEWSTDVELKDTDTADFSVKMVLPSGSALVIGSLMNQTYGKYDQVFYNDRYFNLKTMKIKKGNIITEITPGTFDDNFKKKSGQMICKIK